MPKPLLYTADVARHYGVSESRIRQVILAEKLAPTGKDGRWHLWSPAMLPRLNPRKIRNRRYRRKLGKNP